MYIQSSFANKILQTGFRIVLKVTFLKKRDNHFLWKQLFPY